MPQGYMYEIYDMKEKKTIPGPLQSKEVRQIIGITGCVPEQVKCGTVFKGRYRVTIIGEWGSRDESWAEEWDKARLRLLNAGKRNRQQN